MIGPLCAMRAFAVVVVISATTIATFDEPVGADTPTLVASPAVGLVDGRQLAVTGQGFAPGTTTTVFQCEAAPVGIIDCDWGTANTVAVAPDGTLSVEVLDAAVLGGSGDPRPTNHRPYRDRVRHPRRPR